MSNLKEELRLLKAQEKEVKAKIAECEQSLINQHKIELQETLDSKPEPYGDVTIGDLLFKIPKNVKWDTEALLSIAATLNDPEAYIDYKLTVQESVYKTLPLELKAAFGKARSIKPGKINVSLK